MIMPTLLKAKSCLKKLLMLIKKNLSSGHIENRIPKKNNIEEDLRPATSSHQILSDEHEAP